MPVEIKELQIVTIVTDNKGAMNNSSSAPSASDPDKIIAACVEQVLEILKQKNER
jgi:hypothetical protein